MYFDIMFCSLCGAPGTNKTTCPMNPKAVTHGIVNVDKHIPQAAHLSNRKIIEMYEDRLGYFLNLVRNPLKDINEYFEISCVRHTLLTWFLNQYVVPTDPRVLETIGLLIDLGADLKKPMITQTKRIYPFQQVENDKIRHLLVSKGSPHYISYKDILYARHVDDLLKSVLNGSVVMSDKIEPDFIRQRNLEGTHAASLAREIMIMQDVKELVYTEELEGLSAQLLVLTLERVLSGHTVLSAPITRVKKGTTLLERLRGRLAISNPSKRDDLERAVNLVEHIESGGDTKPARLIPFGASS